MVRALVDMLGLQTIAAVCTKFIAGYDLVPALVTEISAHFTYASVRLVSDLIGIISKFNAIRLIIHWSVDLSQNVCCQPLLFLKLAGDIFRTVIRLAFRLKGFNFFQEHLILDLILIDHCGGSMCRIKTRHKWPAEYITNGNHNDQYDDDDKNIHANPFW